MPSQIARPTPIRGRRHTRIAASTNTWTMKTRSRASVTRAIVPRASRGPRWHLGRMRAMSVVDAPTPRAPFVALSTLWLVLTGTLCNLRCTHCLNTSGPDAPWLPPLDGAVGRRAVRAIRSLDARGLLPIVTATEIDGAPDAYDRFRALLSGLGIARPRVKILPVFPVGRAAGDSVARLSDADLEGFDRTALQC